MTDRNVARRALVVGAPREQVDGVGHDVRAMAELLGRRGFAVDVWLGDRATRDGILTGYNALIDACRPGDAAVVYFAGHGFSAVVDREPLRLWQGICPTDMSATDTDDFRGITAWELSIKLAELTRRTHNVTVIMDCCHAAHMSRDAAVHRAVPRALPHPFRRGFAAHLAALREFYGAAFDAVNPLGDPHAVRVVACGEDECALEYIGDDDQRRGAFTDALLQVLQAVEAVPISWAAIEDAIRERVVRRFPVQRPAIWGPARRRLFSLEEQADTRDVVSIRRVAEQDFELGAGDLHGVRIDDVYGVMPCGFQTYRAAEAIAEVRINTVAAVTARAVAVAWSNGHSELPLGAIAVPIEKHAYRHPVRLDIPATARDAIEAELAGSRILRVAAPKEAPVVATLRMTGTALTIEDREGPLFPETRFPEDLQATVKNLANLGAAQAVRDLEGEHGVAANELEIEWGTVVQGEMHAMPACGGALALLDRFYVRVKNTTARSLYVHVFNIGLRGTIQLLTRSDPTGFELNSRVPELVLGRTPAGILQGIGLAWPAGMPRDTFPRIDELVVIASPAPANLRGLETTEGPIAMRGASNKLESLLAQVQDGQGRNLRGEEPIDGYYMKRLSYALHPRDAVMGDVPFAIEDGASAQAPEAWIAQHPEPAAAPPEHSRVGVELTELSVDRSPVLSGDLRFDVLVCTRSHGARGHATWTQRCRGVGDRAQLALANAMVFPGPIDELVDLCMWVSRDTGGPDLAELLARRAGSPDFEDAAGLLARGAGGPAVPLVTTWGACTVLARIAWDSLRQATGMSSVGLCRLYGPATSYLAVPGRPSGPYHAGGFSWCFASHTGLASLETEL